MGRQAGAVGLPAKSFGEEISFWRIRGAVNEIKMSEILLGLKQ